MNRTLTNGNGRTRHDAARSRFSLTETIYDEHAEQAVLASILLSEGTNVAELPDFKPDPFFLERHQHIARAMVALSQGSGTITLETVNARLDEWGLSGDAGGFIYLTQLMGSSVSINPAAICGAWEIVCDRWIRRQLAYIATELADTRRSPNESLATLVPKLEQIQQGMRSSSADLWEPFRRTLADAYVERPPITYAVNPLFAKPSLNVVYGSPGDLKSMALADCAVCVVAGLEWLPPQPHETGIAFITQPSPVLWLDFDNGRNRTDNRFEALAHARGVDSSVPLSYYPMPNPWLDASDSRAVDALLERIQRANAGLVFIDNLAVIAGGADENSVQMASVMANLRRLAESAGAALVLIHHQRKSNGGNARAGDALRGHSSIEAALDLALLVEREERSDIITFRATKARGMDVAPFAARFTYEHKPNTTELAEARFYGAPVGDGTGNHKVQQAILDAVRGNAGMNQEELVGKVKVTMPEVGDNRVRTAIKHLVNADQLCELKGKARALHYQLKG